MFAAQRALTCRVVVSHVVVAAVLIVLLMIGRVTGLGGAALTRDPAATLGAHTFTGAISHLTALCWGAVAVMALFAGR